MKSLGRDYTVYHILPLICDRLCINHPFTAFCWNWDQYTTREHIYCWSKWYFYFFNQTFLCKVMSFWMRTIHKLIQSHSVLINSEHVHCRTSGSVRHRTIAWKYAYKNLVLHSGSSTHSVAMQVRSSACDWSSRIDYWTLNSHNVNSMFAV